MEDNETTTGGVQSTLRFILWVVVFLAVGRYWAWGDLKAAFQVEELLSITSLFLWGEVLLKGAVSWWLASIVSGTIYILPEWQRLVLLRMGKFAGIKGPGVFIIPPFFYSVADVIDIRVVTEKVEATATLTKDNVPVTVTAAVEYRVENPKKAVLDVKKYRGTILWVATEALKSTIGRLSLVELLGERIKIANELKVQIDGGVEKYGVDVIAVRITDVDTPPTLIEELAVVARAERAARAKSIEAEAEKQVATSLAEAAQTLAAQPGALQLRQLEALREMSKDPSQTIIIYPMELGIGGLIASAAAGAQSVKSQEKK